MERAKFPRWPVSLAPPRAAAIARNRRRMKPKTGRDLCPKAPHAKSLRLGSSLCQNGQTQSDQTKPNQARDREPVEEDAGCSPYDPKPIKLTQDGNEERQKKANPLNSHCDRGASR